MYTYLHILSIHTYVHNYLTNEAQRYVCIMYLYLITNGATSHLHVSSRSIRMPHTRFE